MFETRPHDVTVETRADGSLVIGSAHALGPVVRSVGVWLDRWADAAPDRVFIAERSGVGWREARYGAVRDAALALAGGLMGHGIGPGARIAILSGPSVDHAILMLAAHYIGAVVVPLAEQYSLIPDAHPRLAYCIDKCAPQMVYAANARAFGPALALPCFDGLLRVVSDPEGAAPGTLSLDAMMTGGDGVAAAHAAVDHGTLAKILFTSGSTSNPKGVPNTHGMMCVNQAQYLACLPILGQKVHTMLDWLPWNHTFAGNSNFNMILSNGGSLYLDDGKPLPALFPRTLENLAMKPPSLAFNVPVAHAQIIAALRKDESLKRAYFEPMDIFFYAGASLPADLWAAVEEMAMEVKGELPLMTSSWGMTETAPSSLIYHEYGAQTGMIGVPVPEHEARLLPIGDNRYELRVRGPNVFDGYLDDPKRTADGFDEERFFITGDAVRFADPGNPNRGVMFDGRIGEDFKLTTGTWVQAGNLRLAALGALAGLVQDLVIAGEGRDEIGIMIFASPARGFTGTGAVEDAGYLAEIRARLATLAEKATGSSNRIARAIVMAEPPSVGDGEITAKGSINIRTVLDRRADLLARLYDNADPAVIRV